MCLFDLATEEVTIWQGGANIQNSAPLVALAAPLAKLVAGAAWQQSVMQVYAVLWLLHYVVYIAGFWACSSDTKARPGKTGPLLVLQALAAFAGDGQLVLGVAAQIAYYYELRVALPALAVLVVGRAGFDLPLMLGMTGIAHIGPAFMRNMFGYQVRDMLVVFSMGYIARLARQSRDRLQDANALLRATEQKLADAERDAERMRIARDLHDNVGHQLTAINLHLELGMRRASETVPAAIRTARELAGAVLAKLRVAVSREASADGSTDVSSDVSTDLPAVAAVSDIKPRDANLFAWLGAGVCLFAMALDMVSLWIEQAPRITFAPNYAICKWLVGLWLPAGAALEPALHTVYSWSWVLFYLAFSAAFWSAARAPAMGRKVICLWWVQIVLAVLFHGQYLYALLPQAAYRLPLRRALIWFGIVATGSIVAVGPYVAGWTDFQKLNSIMQWYFPLKIPRDEMVFFIAGLLARSVASRRARLAVIHGELHEARHRLGVAARVAERLRIAGELNQVLGHDLAALNLQLDLGMRQSGEQLAQSVGVAHQAGRQLFDNIRSAIERGRHEEARQADLAADLRTLCAGVPQPQVCLTLGALPPLPAGLGYSLYCCVQEGITNAVRHAGASLLEVELQQEGGEAVLVMADDGRGMQNSEEGNGLRGMRARVLQHAGSMHVVSAAPAAPGMGCRIEIRIPLTPTTAANSAEKAEQSP